MKKFISRKPRNIAKNEAFLSKNQKFQKNAKKIEKTIDFLKSMCYNTTVVYGKGIPKLKLTSIRRCNRMAKCEVCGKGVTFGCNVSHSNRKTNRTFKPNIRKVKVVENGTHKTVNVCSRCLRSNKVTRA